MKSYLYKKKSCAREISWNNNYTWLGPKLQILDIVYQKWIDFPHEKEYQIQKTICEQIYFYLFPSNYYSPHRFLTNLKNIYPFLNIFFHFSMFSISLMHIYIFKTILVENLDSLATKFGTSCMNSNPYKLVKVTKALGWLNKFMCFVGHYKDLHHKINIRHFLQFEPKPHYVWFIINSHIFITNLNPWRRHF